eukprot:CAMPEP_0172160254 /NCGR_PEP_ID=MMETSP1050-20130122/5456_1 /TAXON_ID=233186 /ORGANISM="Cryptomonas curvata, Strain CCAP979/52" /LENGTH=193 /DNA_ID=CAMNT_0012829997 /DNA_START=164 /DNA_END=742 /DNA_ORIENTATION=-
MQSSEAKTRIMVFGATGKVGSELCKILTATPQSTECHAFVRNISSAKDILGPSTILHQGDLSNISSIQEALARSSATRVFLACRNGPMQAELEGNVVRAAAAHGVDHLVKLATAEPLMESTGVGQAHRAVEQELELSGLRFTSLRANYFMQNLLQTGIVVGRGYSPAAMLSTGVFSSPFKTSRISMIDSRDVA